MPPDDPLHPVLDLDLPGQAVPAGPCTRAALADLGISSTTLGRLLRSGRVVRVLRGVYAASATAQDQAFRATAAGLVLDPGLVVARRTAAWVHGADPVALALSRASSGARGVPTQRARRADLPDRDVMELGGVPATTPLRTALDLARTDSEAVALAVADHLLASGRLGMTALLAGLTGGAPDPRVRELLVLADDRARGAVESVLRLRWVRSALPTPVPGHVVPGHRAAVRLALALPDHRFGVLLRSAVGGSDAAVDDLDRLRDRGWRIAVLPDARVLRGDPGALGRHLEREYHQALLGAVG